MCSLCLMKAEEGQLSWDWRHSQVVWASGIELRTSEKATVLLMAEPFLQAILFPLGFRVMRM